MNVAFTPTPTVRVGVIGVGARGTEMLGTMLYMDGLQVQALCDIVPSKVAAGQQLLTSAGRPNPTGYTAGDYDFENLCRRDDIDVVYIATPWEWHTTMAVYAMNQGKHAWVEVPAATTLDECWQLVFTSEQTRRHCIMTENCCYGYNELMLLNMVRDDFFGNVTHGEAAYIDDIRIELCTYLGWRRAWHTRVDGNIYPTHGLGPVARYMGINYQDRFQSLVSFSSPESGLSTYVREFLPADSPIRSEKFICGDTNTSVVKTAQGRTIMLQHSVTQPRPYDRNNLIAGPKATFRDFPPRIWVYHGQESSSGDWGPIDPYKPQYEDPLWTNYGAAAAAAGANGGIDFMMLFRFLQFFHQGLVPDINVYDAAAWSAPMPLSIASVASGGTPQIFPDFVTRG